MDKNSSFEWKKIRNACRILMANAFGNEPFGRPKRSWKNNRILL
jgi:hypothetical protein